MDMSMTATRFFNPCGVAATAALAHRTTASERRCLICTGVPVLSEALQWRRTNNLTMVVNSDAVSDEIAVELNDRFWKRLCVFAARRLRDRYAAEDVAQETLRRALEALRDRRVENLDALPAFIFQTARNICMHYGRSVRRE